MFQCPLGLTRDIDLAFLKAPDQILGREIDQFDRIGTVEDRVGNRLADTNARDLRDDVVQAFDVLDVDSGIDVDAVRQQFHDIEIALRMAAARRVGVGEFVDERSVGRVRYPFERTCHEPRHVSDGITGAPQIQLGRDTRNTSWVPGRKKTKPREDLLASAATLLDTICPRLSGRLSNRPQWPHFNVR